MPLPSATAEAKGADSSAPSAQKQEEELDAPMVSTSLRGPWGQLEFFEVNLEAPLDLIRANLPASIRTRWFFPKMSPDMVGGFLEKLQLGPDLEERLKDQNRWIQEPEGTSIFPRIEDLERIPKEARAILYKKLSASPENPHHVEPEILYGASLEESFKGFVISQRVLDFFQNTVYRYGSTLLFADTPGALSLAQSEEERLTIMRALSRTPSLVAKLILASGSSVELSQYWQKGFRLKDTSTFMASIKRYKSIDRIDLVHLLPANIRRILYTFPDPTLSRSGYLPDCHWSSLNFFNPQPLERLGDPSQATAYALEYFTPVTPPYTLGDVLFFSDTQTGDAYHSCCYVADDIVFTKNGRSPLQPWVLMKLEKVKSLYDMHFQTEVKAYRRKDLQP